MALITLPKKKLEHELLQEIRATANCEDIHEIEIARIEDSRFGMNWAVSHIEHGKGGVAVAIEAAFLAERKLWDLYSLE
jgi:hypothetical protein